MRMGDLLVWADLLHRTLCKFGALHLYVCLLSGLVRPAHAGHGERGQAATTAASLKTLSKLLFSLPVLQTR